jgi:LmbE family N-acetylglucosaminyl deacetylase
VNSNHLREILSGCQADARVLLVAAHPDDETIAAGARLHMLGQLTIVHVTDGSPRSMIDAHRLGFPTRDSYAAERRKELLAALAKSGANPALIELGIPDQDCVYRLEEMTHSLNEVILRTRPDIVLTHPYEGGHPDHDCCAFAVRQALDGMTIPLAEFASYHLIDSQFRTGEFLPGATEVQSFPLDPEQQSRKGRMMECFRTQRETLAPFGTNVERFRLAPEYDFTQRPHAGPLNYERFGWEVTGDTFCEQVSRTLEG